MDLVDVVGIRRRAVSPLSKVRTGLFVSIAEARGATTGRSARARHRCMCVDVCGGNDDECLDMRSLG